MKLLVVTPHFYPENFKVNDLAFELQRRGHEVTVLTAIPDYPQGHYYDGYGLFKKRQESINGVKVIRTIIIPRHDGSAKWLGLNYLSYTFFSIMRSLHIAIFKKYDAIIVHETSPMMVGIPAVIVKKIQRIPIHFWVLDLWPESLAAAGGIKNKLVLKSFGKLSKWLYDNCRSILISSRGFAKSINTLGDYSDKIEYFPNWNDVRVGSGYHGAIPQLPQGFNVLFAGNIGDAQDMPAILECARLVKGSNINIILVGDGRKKQFIEDAKDREDLDNLYLLGRYPLEAMAEIFAKAEVLFLSLKDAPIFSLTVPAKLQAYMASGKPVIAMMNGEGSELIKKADCGWVVPAGDSHSLAQLLRDISSLDAEVLAQKGHNGRLYSEKHFDFKTSMNNLENILQIN